STLSGGAYGSFTVNVVPVDGADPPIYSIVAKLTLGGKLGTTSSSSAEQGASGSASANFSAGMVAVFAHQLSEEDTKQNLAALGAGSGSTPVAAREMAVFKALQSEGPAAAQAVYSGAAAVKDPNAQMAPGDSVTVDTQTGVDVKLGGGAKDDGLGVGGSIS